MRGAEVHGESDDLGPGGLADMVVIGHAGVSIVHAGVVSRTSAGGSGYAVAASAGALIGRSGRPGSPGGDGLRPRTSQAPQGRPDRRHGTARPVREAAYPRVRRRHPLLQRRTGRRGHRPARDLPPALPGRGPYPPRHRAARSAAGVAGVPARPRLPGQISADMFEHYVATYPCASREVCDNVDLIFMNQAEYDGLYGDAQLPVPKAPLIVKRGSAGARLLVDGHPQEVEAAQEPEPWTRRAAARSWPACSSRCGRRAAGARGPEVRGSRRDKLRRRLSASPART